MMSDAQYDDYVNAQYAEQHDDQARDTLREIINQLGPAECVRIVAELDPSVASALTLRSLIESAKIGEHDAWFGGEPVSLGDDQSAIKTAWAAGAIRWLRAVVERTPNERPN